MKQRVFIFLLALLSIPVFFAATTLPVSAHIIKRQGPITLLLHVNPNDEPQAGAESQLLFSGANDNSVFKFSDYVSEVSVTQNGRKLLDRKIRAAADTFDTIEVSYMFPKIGVYDIVIKSTPVKGAKADAFAIDYPLRIDEVAPPVVHKPDKAVIIGVVGFIVALVVLRLIAET